MIAILALVLAPAAEAARPDSYAYDPRYYDGELATISISPVHLLAPMVEVTGEFSIDPTRSVAVIGGLGAEQGRTLFEMGGQYREYVVGGFRTGINLGIEAKYSNTSLFGYDEPMAMFGPFMGAKLTLALFTAEMQGGGQLVVRDSGLSFGPLLNLTMGITF